jgi:hypothetical protein
MSMLKKRIAELKSHDAKPRSTAAEKRSVAAGEADVLRKERSDLILSLGKEHGDSLVEKTIADQGCEWFTCPDKFVRIVKLILKYGAERVNEMSMSNWQAAPRWLDFSQVDRLEIFLGAASNGEDVTKHPTYQKFSLMLKAARDSAKLKEWNDKLAFAEAPQPVIDRLMAEYEVAKKRIMNFNTNGAAG